MIKVESISYIQKHAYISLVIGLYIMIKSKLRIYEENHK